MALGLIGKKLGMTQVFDENGHVVPVTVIEAGPCLVVQKKTAAATERLRKVKLKDGSVAELKVSKSDGYDSVKLGFVEKRKKLKKADAGQYAEGVLPRKYLKEFRLTGDELQSVDQGATLTVEMFEGAAFVDVCGMSKGKGFQGVIRRHNFAGGPKTHGSHFHRAPGSIGQCAWPAKTFKGKKMPGRMGNDRVTVQNLKVVSVDTEKNLILVKGSVPGANNSILYVKKSVKKAVK